MSRFRGLVAVLVVSLLGCGWVARAGSSESLEQAKALVGSGDFDAAVPVLADFVRRGGANAGEATRLIVVCYEQRHNVAGAVPVLSGLLAEPAVSLSARKDIAIQLAACYERSKSWDGAIGVYQRLAADYPAEASRYHSKLGVLYRERKRDLVRAEAAFRLAVKQDPADQGSQFQVASCLCAQGKVREGLEYLAALGNTQIAPDKLAFMTGQILYADAHDAKAAMETWGRLCADYPQSPIALEARGRIANLLMARGSAGEARAILEALIAEHPGDPLVPRWEYDLACCLRRSRMLAEARDRFRKLTNKCHEPPLADGAWYQVGECSLALKDYVTARKAYQELVDRFPESHLAEIGRKRLAALPE